MRRDGVLHLDRIDVLASGHDHVLHPIDEVQIPGSVEVSGVARAIPAAAERGLGQLRLLPVLAHEVAASCADLAILPRGRDRVVLAAHADADADHRSTGGTQDRTTPAMVGGGEERQDRRALGHAVALREVHFGEGGHDPLEQSRGHRRGPVDQVAQRLETTRSEVGMVQHHCDHRGHHHGPVDAVVLDGLHHLLRLEQGHEHRGATGCRYAQHATHRRSVEHGGLVQVHPLLAEVDCEADVVEVQHLGPLIQQHALGSSGGASRVHHHDRVRFVGFRWDDRLAGIDQVLVAHVVRQVAVAHQHHVTQR